MWLEFPWQMPKKCNSVSKMVQVKHRELWVKTATLYPHRQVEKNGNNILNTICARFWIFKEYSLVAWIVTNLPAKQETQVWSLGRKDPLEKRIATHSSILAWRFPWSKKPGELYSPWGCRVRHDWATKHTEVAGNLRPFSKCFSIFFPKIWKYKPSTEQKFNCKDYQ